MDGYFHGGAILDDRHTLKIPFTPSPALCSSEHTYPTGDPVNIAMCAEGLGLNNPGTSGAFFLTAAHSLQKSLPFQKSAESRFDLS